MKKIIILSIVAILLQSNKCNTENVRKSEIIKVAFSAVTKCNQRQGGNIGLNPGWDMSPFISDSVIPNSTFETELMASQKNNKDKIQFNYTIDSDSSINAFFTIWDRGDISGLDTFQDGFEFRGSRNIQMSFSAKGQTGVLSIIHNRITQPLTNDVRGGGCYAIYHATILKADKIKGKVQQIKLNDTIAFSDMRAGNYILKIEAPDYLIYAEECNSERCFSGFELKDQFRVILK